LDKGFVNWTIYIQSNIKRRYTGHGFWKKITLLRKHTIFPKSMTCIASFYITLNIISVCYKGFKNWTKDLKIGRYICCNFNLTQDECIS
jgi:hypothetical protein